MKKKLKKNFFLYILAGCTTGFCQNTKLKNIPEALCKIIDDNFLKKKRQALHAVSIGFTHPVKKQEMFFKSELPDDFKKLEKSLNNYYLTKD